MLGSDHAGGFNHVWIWFQGDAVPTVTISGFDMISNDTAYSFTSDSQATFFTFYINLIQY